MATAELTPDDIAFDLEDIFRDQENIEVRKAEVVSADPEARRVTLADDTTIDGDVVVLAAGSQPNFFHTPGAEEFAFPLYSLDDAKRIRSRVLQLFQDASERPELVDEGALTFVVVGGGATGVESAGALAELLHDVMPHVYEHLAIAGARVILVDLGTPCSLRSPTRLTPTRRNSFSGEGSSSGWASPRRRSADHVTLSDGTTLKTHLTVWGGLMAAPLSAQSGVSPGRGGRLDVQPDLTVEGSPGVYALGDFANIPSGNDDALPQLGSVRAAGGRLGGAEHPRGHGGQARPALPLQGQGIMAMIGRKAAVAEVGEHRHELHGRIAFAAWLAHAQLLANAGAEVKAFMAWADEFYVRPHHRRPRCSTRRRSTPRHRLERQLTQEG